MSRIWVGQFSGILSVIRLDLVVLDDVTEGRGSMHRYCSEKKMCTTCLMYWVF